MDKIFGILQRIGRSFMLPIALLPAAGILLGIGGSLTNPTMLAAYHLEGVLGKGTTAYTFLHIMSQAGGIIFDSLPIMFAAGVAIGMAKKEKGVAALAAIIAFFVMHASIGALLDLQKTAMPAGSVTVVCGIKSLQLGVFGGIIVGCGVTFLHNKYYNIQLPRMLAFFGGSRFVPIISSFAYLCIGILLFYVWPLIQPGIVVISGMILDSGYAGTFIYGFMERALIPFGLHHILHLPIWQTPLGGILEVGGKIVDGAQDIFFAQLATPGIEHFSVEATRFLSGDFPIMIFGLPGAALAMYKTAKPENRNKVKGLLLSAALTSIVTGITEPIEFTFLFVAPVLYFLHCVLTGISFVLMHLLNVGVGLTYSAGFIDLFLFGIMQGDDKTNWINIIIVGVIYFFVYYFLFSFIIRRWNLLTPGRGNEEEIKLYTKADVMAEEQGTAKSDDGMSEAICNGLGGKKNIADVDCCITRLRCTVNKPELVDEELLKLTGASGVICNGSGVQVVYGPHVTDIKTNLDEYLLTAPNIEYKKQKNGEKLLKRKNYQLPENIAFLKESGTVQKGEAVMLLISQETEFEHTVKDPLGIHARPAGCIVKLIKEFKENNITFSCNGKIAKGTSVMELMRLGAKQGTVLKISATGPDAAAAIVKLKKYLQEKL